MRSLGWDTEFIETPDTASAKRANITDVVCCFLTTDLVDLGLEVLM